MEAILWADNLSNSMQQTSIFHNKHLHTNRLHAVVEGRHKSDS